MKLWTYWEGDKTPFIELCLATLQKQNPDRFELVTPESLAAMDGSASLLKALEGKPVIIKSNAIRLWLILKYGGVWTDADCVAVRPLDLWSRVESCDLFLVYNKHRRRGPRHALACPFGAPANSPAIRLLFRACMTAIEGMQDQMEPGGYGGLSLGLLSSFWLVSKDKSKIDRAEHWRYNRIPWDKAGSVFMGTDPALLETWMGDNVQLYHLTNKIVKAFSSATEADILAGESLVCRLIRKGLGKQG